MSRSRWNQYHLYIQRVYPPSEGDPGREAFQPLDHQHSCPHVQEPLMEERDNGSWESLVRSTACILCAGGMCADCSFLMCTPHGCICRLCWEELQSGPRAIMQLVLTRMTGQADAFFRSTRQFTTAHNEEHFGTFDCRNHSRTMRNSGMPLALIFQRSGFVCACDSKSRSQSSTAFQSPPRSCGSSLASHLTPSPTSW